jgi:hypothetical protein
MDDISPSSLQASDPFAGEKGGLYADLNREKRGQGDAQDLEQRETQAGVMAPVKPRAEAPHNGPGAETNSDSEKLRMIASASA